MSQELPIYMIGALLPLVITNIAHMILVKRNAWSILAIPIQEKAFGANKTWRGVVFISTVNAGLYLLINHPDGVLMAFLNQKQNLLQLLFTGWIFGIAYVLFELPNSFIKRRMGIEPGASAIHYKGLFTLLDKTDSALGVSLVFYFIHYVSSLDAIFFFLIASGLHFLFSWILYLRNIKKSF